MLVQQPLPRFVSHNRMRMKQPDREAGTRKKLGGPLLLLLVAAGLAGCATSSTVQTRIQDRSAAYAAFSPEVKRLVAVSRIQAGMDTNAVYIAWGQPDEILESGNEHGEYSTWVYRGGFLEETRYWVGRNYPHLEHDYEPRSYVRAEIVFFNDRVQSWRTLPQPAY